MASVNQYNQWTVVVMIILMATTPMHMRLSALSPAGARGRKAYIVYTAGKDSLNPIRALKQVVENITPKEVLMYTYKYINGFAAILTAREVEKLSHVEGVLSVVPSKGYVLHPHPPYRGHGTEDKL